MAPTQESHAAEEIPTEKHGKWVYQLGLDCNPQTFAAHLQAAVSYLILSTISYSFNSY